MYFIALHLLCESLKPGSHVRRKCKRKEIRVNHLNANADENASADARIKKFPFSCVCISHV